MQFYTGDWMKDPALRSVSSSARGLWMDMLCLMHDSDRRGFLQVNGKPVTPEMLARMTGNDAAQVSRDLQELEYSGVYSCTDHGLIFSRRIVRDEAKRQRLRENGKKGGNPRLVGPLVGSLDNQESNQTPNQSGNHPFQGSFVENKGDTGFLDNQESNQDPNQGVNQKEGSSVSSSTSVNNSLSFARGDEKPPGPEPPEPPEIPAAIFDYAVNVLGWLTPDVPLKSLLMDYPPDWIEKAMRKLAMCEKGQRNPTYLRGILQRYRKNGEPDNDGQRNGHSRTDPAKARAREPTDFSDVVTGERL